MFLINKMNDIASKIKLESVFLLKNVKILRGLFFTLALSLLLKKGKYIYTLQ
jgi:hypothetical protein